MVPSPCFSALTATIGNPREHAARLLGLDPSEVALVDRSGAPQGARRFFFYNPSRREHRTRHPRELREVLRAPRLRPRARPRVDNHLRPVAQLRRDHAQVPARQPRRRSPRRRPHGLPRRLSARTATRHRARPARRRHPLRGGDQRPGTRYRHRRSTGRHLRGMARLRGCDVAAFRPSRAPRRNERRRARGPLRSSRSVPCPQPRLSPRLRRRRSAHRSRERRSARAAPQVRCVRAPLRLRTHHRLTRSLRLPRRAQHARSPRLPRPAWRGPRGRRQVPLGRGRLPPPITSRSAPSGGRTSSS